jgi:threonine synthase
MRYYSTSDPQLQKNLREAVLQGLAPDGGLYMPATIPELSKDQIASFHGKSFKDISIEVATALFKTDLPEDVIASITGDAISFDTPLVEVEEQIYSLELFYGPTLAFKDVGARFMARMLGYFTRDLNQEINVLVATSGDTGSAVASGFWNVDGIRVFILYPSGAVSKLQEKQLTTLGGNITALEVSGTFDDCQNMVKKAFLDKELTSKGILTSANSINLARLLPQSFYYFNAWAQLPDKSEFYMSVPSGNFGNLTAGLIAGKMGLPIKKYIVATNINDIVPRYLESGQFNPRPSVPTIANAMDVGNPSNFSRILDLYHHSHEDILEDMSGYTYTDSELKDAIRAVSRESGYILEPHGAAGYRALKDYTKGKENLPGVFIETAHPAKFKDLVESLTGSEVNIPERLMDAASREKVSIALSREYNDLKEYLSSEI